MGVGGGGGGRGGGGGVGAGCGGFSGRIFRFSIALTFAPSHFGKILYSQLEM